MELQQPIKLYAYYSNLRPITQPFQENQFQNSHITPIATKVNKIRINFQKKKRPIPSGAFKELRKLHYTYIRQKVATKTVISTLEKFHEDVVLNKALTSRIKETGKLDVLVHSLGNHLRRNIKLNQNESLRDYFLRLNSLIASFVTILEDCTSKELISSLELIKRMSEFEFLRANWDISKMVACRLNFGINTAVEPSFTIENEVRTLLEEYEDIKKGFYDKQNRYIFIDNKERLNRIQKQLDSLYFSEPQLLFNPPKTRKPIGIILRHIETTEMDDSKSQVTLDLRGLNIPIIAEYAVKILTREEIGALTVHATKLDGTKNPKHLKRDLNLNVCDISENNELDITVDLEGIVLRIAIRKELEVTDSNDYICSLNNFAPVNPEIVYQKLMFDFLSDLVERFPKKSDQDIQLSNEVQALMSECAFKWRLSEFQQALIWFDLLIIFYEDKSVPIHAVRIAFENIVQIQKIMIHHEEDLKKTTYFSSTTRLEEKLINYLQDYQVWVSKPDEVEDAVFILLKLNEESEKRIVQRLSPFIKATVTKVYLEFKVKHSQNEDDTTAAAVLTIESAVSELEKISQIKVQSDFYGIFYSAFYSLISTTIQEVIQEWPQDFSELQNILSLYQSSMLFNNLSEGLTLDFDGLEKYFKPYIYMWLEYMRTKSKEWAKSIVISDDLKPVNEKEAHSNAVVDLFCFLNEEKNCFDQLQWPDRQERIEFERILLSIIYESVVDFCTLNQESIYRSFKSTTSSLGKATLKRFHSKVAGINIINEVCIKLNNIDKAITNMMEMLPTFKCLEINPAELKLTQSITNISTTINIKVICARGLKPKDITTGMDPYVIIKTQMSEILCKTIALTATIAPCWNQTFFLDRVYPSVLKVNLYDKEAIGDDVFGKGMLYLNRNLLPGLYSKVTLWLSLNRPHTRVLLRVGLGKSNRRSEVTPEFLKYLHQTIFDNFEDTKSILVYQLVDFIELRLRRIFKLYASSTTRKVLQKLKNSVRDASVEETDEKLEPCFDLLDSNMAILNNNLDKKLATEIIESLWDEILERFGDLILPPLLSFPSSSSKNNKERGNIIKIPNEKQLTWIKTSVELFKVFFHGSGDGLPMERLQKLKYHSLHDAIEYFSTPIPLLTKLVVEKGKNFASGLSSNYLRGTSVLHEGTLYTPEVLLVDFPNNVLRVLLTKNESQCVSFVRRHVMNNYLIKTITS